MNYIIGINNDWNSDRNQRISKELNETDSVLLYADSFDLTIDFISNNSKHNFLIFIRSTFERFQSIDLSHFFNKPNIILSIVLNEKIDYYQLNNFFEYVSTMKCKAELVLSSRILSEESTVLAVVQLLQIYDFEIRISKHVGSVYKFMNDLNTFQEKLLSRECEIILKPLSIPFKSDCKDMHCKFINLSSAMIQDFSVSLCNKSIGSDVETIVAASSVEYTLLPDVVGNDRGAYLYLREKALKRISDRILSQKHVASSEQKDLILVYADRLRNRMSAPYPPIGLYYLKAVVRKAGYTCEVVECNECNFKSIYEKHIANGCKVVGFYCACNNEYLVSNMIKYIKRNSSIPVIIGGPQTFSMGEEFIKSTNVDIISLGEGEETTVELLNYYIKNEGDLRSIRNVRCLINGQYYDNPLREIIMDLDALPFAKIKHTDIVQNNTIGRIFVLTGRGCPNRCTFCFEGANSRKVRYRSMQNVFEEINYLLNEFPLAGLLHVLDDTFTCNEKRVRDFCSRMKEIRKTRKIEWVCEAHINTIYNKPDLLQTMIDSGLKGFQIGLESGNDEVLKAYRKNTNVAMIKEFINMCASVSNEVFIEGNIIIGGPFESKETINDSYNLCKYLITHGRGMVELQALSFVPLPNTDITLNPEKYGLKIMWDKMDTSTLAMLDIVTESQHLTCEELQKEKDKFNDGLSTCYLKETLKLSSNQIMRFWNAQSNQFVSSSKWGAALNNFEHFRNYALLEFYNSIKPIDDFSKLIPIRTFESTSYINKLVQEYNYFLSELDNKILLYSNGKYNTEDISRILSVDSFQLKQRIDDLGSKCLLRMSLV